VSIRVHSWLIFICAYLRSSAVGVLWFVVAHICPSD
jgi:hypothetical protein